MLLLLAGLLGVLVLTGLAWWLALLGKLLAAGFRLIVGSVHRSDHEAQ